MNDFEILNAGVDASIETKISLTGAYDDACACYYGGFVVTNNRMKKIVHSEKCLNRVSAVIFIPKYRKGERLEILKHQVVLLRRLGTLQKNLIIGML